MSADSDLSRPRGPKLSGPVVMLLGNLHLAAIPALVRIATLRGVPSSQATFVRFLFSSLLLIALAWIGLARPRPRNWRLLFWRGLLGGLSVSTYYVALQLTSSGKGALLNYTHALWANLFAVTILRRKPGPGFWWILALAGAGLWLVLDPDFSRVNRGDALGLLSGIFGGAAILTVKDLRRTDDAVTIFSSFSYLGLVTAIVPYGIALSPDHELGELWKWTDAIGWSALLAMAAASMIGQLLFTHAYADTSIPMGTILSLTVPAIAALVGWTLLDEPLEAQFLVGAAMILVACGALGMQEGYLPSGRSRRLPKPPPEGAPRPEREDEPPTMPIVAPPMD